MVVTVWISASPHLPPERRFLPPEGRLYPYPILVQDPPLHYFTSHSAPDADGARGEVPQVGRQVPVLEFVCFTEG